MAKKLTAKMKAKLVEFIDAPNGQQIVDLLDSLFDEVNSLPDEKRRSLLVSVGSAFVQAGVTARVYRMPKRKAKKRAISH